MRITRLLTGYRRSDIRSVSMVFISSKRCSLIIYVCCIGVSLTLTSSPSFAIVVNPTSAEIEDALHEGNAAAKARTPPIQFYATFGSTKELTPHGSLMTKLSGLAVMSAHFALRAVEPSQEEIQHILEETNLQVSVTIFGSSPRFAMDSYMVLKQGDQIIKPARVRFDARAARTSVWPRMPSYRAKVIASFPYKSFDPDRPTTITVFPGEGGETSFDLDFHMIP